MHALLGHIGIKADPQLLLEQLAEVIWTQIDVHGHVFEAQLIGKMGVDVAQRLLDLGIIHRPGFAASYLRQFRFVFIDNNQVNLTLDAIIDNQLEQIG